MRNSVLILIVYYPVFIAMMLLQASCNKNAGKTEMAVTGCATCLPAVVQIQDKLPRESITFILGEDRDTENLYYTKAYDYYCYNPEGRTDQIVTDCRSLLEVRDFLMTNPPSKGEPWGLINLVSHGNQWVGLSVPVVPGARRTTADQLIDLIKDDVFKELPDSIIDSDSEINIRACGVGNDSELLKAVSLAFGGVINKPQTKASMCFEYYTSERSNGIVTGSSRCEAQTWFTCYKKGYRPDDRILLRRLKNLYPNANIKWKDALSRESPRWTGDIYHYTFEVPVLWVVKYEDNDTLPDISTNDMKIKWVREQTDLMRTLKKIKIEPEKFNWWFRKIYCKNEDGTRSPAIWAKGYCTILCVLKPLKDKEISI